MRNFTSMLQSTRLLYCQKQLSTCRAVISTLHSNDGGRRYSHTGNDENETKEKWNNVKNGMWGIGGFAGIAAGFEIFKYLDNKDKQVEKDQITPTSGQSLLPNDSPWAKWHTTVRQDLPTYRLKDVNKHNTLENGVWISFGRGVYDVTDFVSKHPGGDKIMIGAGAAIDPFWHFYQQHLSENVLRLLDTFRIGNLHPDDDVGTEDLSSQWALEPKRHHLLNPTSLKPFNAEPPLGVLIENFYTPKEIFFVRNHLPVPDIDEQDYELDVEDEATNKNKTFKLEDIKKLPKHTVTAVLMCGGNRRSEMHEVKAVRGLSWGAGAVGNAKWSGARLKDVLALLGVKSDEKRHVIFEGYDLDATSRPFGASIPLSKAVDDRGDVILAYEMNGEPLPRDHGYPLRVVVPGVIGVRNVKWLARILVSEKESDSHWQQKDYKGFSPSTDWDNVDFSKSPPIQNMPVTSAICSPLAGQKAKIKDGLIEVKGYAWSGGGNRIVRVDLTTDGGESWHVAELQQEDAPAGRHFGWTLWTAQLPVPKGAKEIEIWSKAADSNYNVQPETFKNTWNLRGVLSHAYSRVKIILE